MVASEFKSWGLKSVGVEGVGVGEVSLLMGQCLRKGIAPPQFFYFYAEMECLVYF